MGQADSLGVAVIGAGFMGEIHTRALAKEKRAELRWVLDHTENKARKLVQLYRRERGLKGRVPLKATTDLNQIMDDDAVQVVYVCTQPKSHESLAAQFLRSGRSVFVEKPITWTVSQGVRLVRAEKQSKQTLFVGHVCRFFPEYVQIRQSLEAGSIGSPAMVRASRCMGNPGGWYEDPKRSLGVPGDLLLHDFDLLLWMLGDAVRVYGMSRARRPPIGEQHFLASLRHRGNVISHLQGSWAHGDGFRTQFEISGTEGVLEFDSARRLPLVVKKIGSKQSGSALVVPESPTAHSPYDVQTQHFFDVLQQRCKPRIQAAEALRSLEVALAAAQSAKKKLPISLAKNALRQGARR